MQISPRFHGMQITLAPHSTSHEPLIEKITITPRNTPPGRDVIEINGQPVEKKSDTLGLISDLLYDFGSNNLLCKHGQAALIRPALSKIIEVSLPETKLKTAILNTLQSGEMEIAEKERCLHFRPTVSAS